MISCSDYVTIPVTVLQNILLNTDWLIFNLSPTIHKFGNDFTHSGLSVVRHAHHPEFFEELSEH